MNKNLLIAAGFFLAVIVVGFFLIPKKVKAPIVNNQVAPTSASAPTSSSSEVKDFTVLATEFSFSPSIITVDQGDRVRITLQNKGTTPHNLTISGLNQSTGIVNPGSEDTIEFTADTQGSFDFACTVDSHKDKGMIGKIEVN